MLFKVLKPVVTIDNTATTSISVILSVTEFGLIEIPLSAGVAIKR